MTAKKRRLAFLEAVDAEKCAHHKVSPLPDEKHSARYTWEFDVKILRPNFCLRLRGVFPVFAPRFPDMSSQLSTGVALLRSEENLPRELATMVPGAPFSKFRSSSSFSKSHPSKVSQCNFIPVPENS